MSVARGYESGESPIRSRAELRSEHHPFPALRIEEMHRRGMDGDRHGVVDPRRHVRAHRRDQIVAARDAYIHDLLTPEGLDERHDATRRAIRGAAKGDVVRPYTEH